MSHAHDRTLLARLGFADPDARDRRHDYACQFLASPEVASRLARRLMGDWGCEGRMEDRSGSSAVWFDYVATRADPAAVAATMEPALSKGANQYRTTVGFADVVVGWTATETRRGPASRVACDWVEAVVPLARGSWDCTLERFYVARAALPEALRDRAGAEERVPCTASAGARATAAGRAEIVVRVPQYRQEAYEHVARVELVCQAVVEVKIARVGLGDLLRQIALYREYAESLPWVADYRGRADRRGIRDWVVAAPFAWDAGDLETLRRERVRTVRLGPEFERYCAARKTAAAEASEIEL